MAEKIEVTEEEVKQIQEMHEELGWSPKRIAKKMRFSEGPVTKVIKRNNFKRKNFKEIKANKLTKELLEKLYLNERMAIAEIAKLLEVPKGLVSNKLRELKIPVRNQGGMKLDISKETLEDLIVSQRKTYAEIAGMYSCAVTTISALKRKYNIILEPRTKISLPVEVLTHMYEVLRMSEEEIATSLGCCRSIIHDRLMEAGLIKNHYEKYRDQVKKMCEEGKCFKEIAKSIGVSHNSIGRIVRILGYQPQRFTLERVTYEELHDKLIIKERELKDVASEYNVSTATIKEKARELGINVLKDRLLKKGLTKENLKNLYFNEKLSQREIAEKLGCGRSTVIQKFKEFGIKAKQSENSKISKEFLMEEFVNKNKPLCEISKETGYSIASLRRRVDKWDLSLLKTEEQVKACNKRAYELALNSSRSKAEKEIGELFPTNFTNTHSVINLELDLWYPEKGVAVEYNGDYWHSTKFPRNSGLHIDKRKMCLNKSIKLINIFERDWESTKQREKLKELLKRNLTPDLLETPSGYIKRVQDSQRHKFEKDFNLEGPSNSSNCVGLYRRNRLISCLSYDIISEGICRIARFTTRSGYLEDYSDLLEYLKAELKFSEITIKFDNRYYWDGDFAKYGFELKKEVDPEPFYVLNTKAVRKEEASDKYINHSRCREVYDCGRTIMSLT